MTNKQPDLVFGLVAPIGAKIEILHAALKAEIKKYDYEVFDINVSEIIEKLAPLVSDNPKNAPTKLRIQDKISFGNKICKASEEKGFLSLAAIKAISRIKGQKNSEDEDEDKTQKGYAFIIRQLKRPEEIKKLRSVYGDHFIQISANNDQDEKLNFLKELVSREYQEKTPEDVEEFSRRLIRNDSNDQDDEYGQKISDTFYTADFFVHCKSRESVESNIRRFLKGVFGSNLLSPTKDEYGSYFAKAASLKTVDMSRQVGAAIFTKEGEIVITGCNDVAKAGGGVFWEEDEDKHRDIDIGSEANKQETSRIIYNFLQTLYNQKVTQKTPEQVLSTNSIKTAISESMIGEITEYGRMVHAEMNAITDAARLGRPLKGTYMYVTTYPCHNCAKHIVSSGISKVVYIEPYPKSRAPILYRHAISEGTDEKSVNFTHFYGISPRMYKMIFERKKRRNEAGRVQEWAEGIPQPVIDIKDFTSEQSLACDRYVEIVSHIKREARASSYVDN